MRERETYCIRVEGHLGDEWSEWFDGMALAQMPDGTTTLSGPVEDQSALHGVLLKLHNMGVALIACDRVCDPTEDNTSSQTIKSIEEG